MSTPVKTRHKYLSVLSGPPSDRQLRAEALRCALDIRKFEIELYWKRTTYFWTLIAAAFAGYFALASSQKHPGLIFLVSCIGFLLSTGWYLVNRGSKFWQENWERHVDILEDEIIGPLYKTTITKSNFYFWKFWSAYPYSVSKVNQLISLFVAILWLGLAVRGFPHRLVDTCLRLDTYWLLAIVTVMFTIFLLAFCRTGSESKPRLINFTKSDLADPNGDKS